MLSSLWLDINWILRFLFPPLPVELIEVVTGTLGTGVSSAATAIIRIKLGFFPLCITEQSSIQVTEYFLLLKCVLQVTAAFSEAAWSDFIEDAELGDCPSSSLLMRSLKRYIRFYLDYH